MPCSAWLRRSAALEGERLGDDAHCQRADFLAGDLGDDGSGARAGAAALAGGDEDHVGLGQRLADLRAGLLGGLAADLGVRAGAQAARELLADVDGLIGIRHQKGLTVGVDGDELHALDARLDHAVNGIGAAAADADDLDDRQMLARIVWHCIPPHYYACFELRFTHSWLYSRGIILHKEGGFATLRPPTATTCTYQSGPHACAHGPLEAIKNATWAYRACAR